MSKGDPIFKPLSLAQHFEAPDDFCGCFGWLCGYSADESFLNDAIDRFTRRMQAQRAYEGQIRLAVILDPGRRQITPKEVPGVMHLALKGEPPFRLMHAKVALLGFCHTSDARQWRLRLIVSTGNWTRQTSQDSLDLAWRVDLSNQDIKSENDFVPQASADIGAAWRMLSWLKRHFDSRVLDARVPGRQDFESESKSVEKWVLRATRRGTDHTPRFFDNRTSSLLDQLPDLVSRHSMQSSRNYLALGSGFYESSEISDKIPSVLTNIADTLREAKLITARPEIDVFVNPKGCQAVANCVPAFNQAGWNVREAGQPECFTRSRSLHAKFIFSANRRENSDICNGAWLYLGSGNLTGPGFANKMALQSGNLEAGVVLVPESLKWLPARGIPPESVVTNLLPLQWNTVVNLDPGSLMAGDEMPDPEVRYSAAPVAYFFWIVAEDICWLQATAETIQPFDLLADNGDACLPDPIKGYSWQGLRPQQVQLRWLCDGHERRAWVPVIDEFGRVAATVLPRIDIEEAWNQLSNFPMPPDEEELDADRDGYAGEDAAPQGSGVPATANYPVRQMMQLIENIAAKQTSVSKLDWVNWCTRLEQCLSQAAGSVVLEEFVKLNLNPLSPLWHCPFRPTFASSGDTVEGVRYECVLNRVESAWNVVGLSRLGSPL